LDHRGSGLMGQSFMVGQIHKNIFDEVETSTMDKSTENFFTQIGSYGVLWIPSMRNVLLLSRKQLGWLWCGV